MEDYPEITCADCKDLAFARNLARQMREGYGRHNSASGEVNAPTPERVAAGNFRFRTRSVLGRFGDRLIRDLMFNCAVGDAVLSDDPDPPNKIYTYLAQYALPSFVDYEAWASGSPPVFRPSERWQFEHVALRVTPDHGLTWQDQYLWVRIE